MTEQTDATSDAGVTDETDATSGASPWLFLLGLVVFLGSAVLFVVDLARGVSIFRSLLGNATGAVVLIGWAALDTYRDPDSEVATVGGASGTALLLYGLYLLLSGLVVTVTGLFLHDQLSLGLLYLGTSVVAVGIGYLIFPTGSVVDEESNQAVAANSADDAET